MTFLCVLCGKWWNAGVQSGWVFFRMISAQENFSNPGILWRENSSLFCQYCCLLETWTPASLLPLFTPSIPSFRIICFIWVSSQTLSVLFFSKQTHICAVLVMVATSEVSVLGLYLEPWPSRSAAVPAQSMPTGSPANPARHKALVRIFKSLHPAHTYGAT